MGVDAIGDQVPDADPLPPKWQQNKIFLLLVFVLILHRPSSLQNRSKGRRLSCHCFKEIKNVLFIYL